MDSDTPLVTETSLDKYDPVVGSVLQRECEVLPTSRGPFAVKEGLTSEKPTTKTTVAAATIAPVLMG